MTKIVLTLICIFTLAACTTYFTLSDSNNMQRDMTVEEVASKVSEAPVKEFDITIYSAPSKKYFVQVYDLYTGKYNSDYFAVYENGKLLYWGYPYEFNKHPDATLNEIGRTAVAEYDKIK